MDKVFILEDNDNRIEIFKVIWSKLADFTIAQSYEEAIKLFNIHEDYSAILLDHDLGYHQFVDSFGQEKTGYHFTEWLVKNYNQDIPIIIHSHNNIGADNMQSKLKTRFKNVNYIPFGNLVNAWEQGILNFLGHYKYD
jgi:CheY-like chemotaxis protein